MRSCSSWERSRSWRLIVNEVAIHHHGYAVARCRCLGLDPDVRLGREGDRAVALQVSLAPGGHREDAHGADTRDRGRGVVGVLALFELDQDIFVAVLEARDAHQVEGLPGGHCVERHLRLAEPSADDRHDVAADLDDDVARVGIVVDPDIRDIGPVDPDEALGASDRRRAVEGDRLGDLVETRVQALDDDLVGVGAAGGGIVVGAGGCDRDRPGALEPARVAVAVLPDDLVGRADIGVVAELVPGFDFADLASGGR